MTTEMMRDYLMDIIRTDSICDERQHYFTEEEIRKMSPDKVKWLYDLCRPNFGERNIYSSHANEWVF